MYCTLNLYTLKSFVVSVDLAEDCEVFIDRIVRQYVNITKN